MDDASLELDAQSIALFTLSHAMPTALLSTATIPFPGPATGFAFFKAFAWKIIQIYSNMPFGLAWLVGIMLGCHGFMLSPAAYFRRA